jgi:hypothetical protein
MGCCRCDPFAWREDDDDAPPLGEILPRARRGAWPAGCAAGEQPRSATPFAGAIAACRVYSSQGVLPAAAILPPLPPRRAATLPASPQRAHQYFCCCWHSNPAASARQRSQPTPLSAPPAAPKLLQLCATRDFAKSIFPPSLLLGREQPCSVCVCAMCIPMCCCRLVLFAPNCWEIKRKCIIFLML